MTNHPVVSICMVTYGHENFIAEAINGVLMQECDFDYELVIGNDDSPDGTDEIVGHIIQNHPNGHRINYHKHQQNKGMMMNFSFILNQCRGRYIALCDGDDYWTDPKKLQKQVNFLENNPDHVLCFHKAEILHPDGSFSADSIAKLPENYENLETLLQYGNYIHTPSVVFRNVLENYPDEFFRSPIGDYFLYVLLAEKGKLNRLTDVMCVYRQGVGFFSQQTDVKISFNIIKFYSCLLSYLSNANHKKIIYERQLRLLESYNEHAAYKFTTTDYLAKNKSARHISKALIKKIIRRK